MKALMPFPLVCLLLAACGGEPSAPTAAEVLERAKGGEKPVVLFFAREKCPLCARMKTEVWSDPALAKALESCVFAEVDAERDAEGAAKHQVSIVPQVLVVAPDGTVTHRLIGFRTAGELTDLLTASD